jgi:hypothetical protein
MFDKLIIYYCNFFIDNKNPYILLQSSVCLYVIISKYNQWVNNKEVQSLEDLPKDLKEKYWNIAMLHQQEKQKRITAAKVAYSLVLMTGKS